jgi:adenine deaminase
MRELQRKLSIARGERPAERLFKNANLVNVLIGEIYRTHVAVDGGRVVGLGDYKAKKIIDFKGAYLAPSLIDGHFHVESIDADDAGVRARGGAAWHGRGGD